MTDFMLFFLFRLFWALFLGFAPGMPNTGERDRYGGFEATTIPLSFWILWSSRFASSFTLACAFCSSDGKKAGATSSVWA